MHIRRHFVEQRAAAAEEALSPSLDDSEYQFVQNQKEQAKPLGNYEMYGKTPKQAAQELQEQLNSQHSFVYESDEQAARREQNSELRGQFELAQPVRRQMEKFKNNHPLSDKDNSLLQGALLNSFRTAPKVLGDPEIKGGCEVSFKDGQVYFDFTGEAVTELVADFIGPRLAKLLEGDR